MEKPPNSQALARDAPRGLLFGRSRTVADTHASLFTLHALALEFGRNFFASNTLRSRRPLRFDILWSDALIDFWAAI